eukprot:353484-Chlamydomonas_euryale.AAC.7
MTRYPPSLPHFYTNFLCTGTWFKNTTHPRQQPRRAVVPRQPCKAVMPRQPCKAVVPRQPCKAVVQMSLFRPLISNVRSHTV